MPDELAASHRSRQMASAMAARSDNQDCDFQLYETVIPMDPSHMGVAVTSIDFAGAPDAFHSNIFGVSGR
jgi:hypothetical protein